MERVEPGTLARRSFVTRGAAATEAVGAAVARAIEALPLLARSGVAVSLEGELGTGKTAFARGVARGLGSHDAVHSPSFTLMHTYEGRLPIYHFDAWMEGRERAFLDGGGAEWLEGGGVALVEWASRVEPWLPLPRLAVFLEHMGPADPDSRRLTLAALGPAAGDGEEPRSLAFAALVAGLRPEPAPGAPNAIEELP